jgi:hypothetical protein
MQKLIERQQRRIVLDAALQAATRRMQERGRARLAKRDRSQTLMALREQGVSPDAVRRQLGFG